MLLIIYLFIFFFTVKFASPHLLSEVVSSTLSMNQFVSISSRLVIC